MVERLLAFAFYGAIGAFVGAGFFATSTILDYPLVAFLVLSGSLFAGSTFGIFHARLPVCLFKIDEDNG